MVPVQSFLDATAVAAIEAIPPWDATNYVIALFKNPLTPAPELTFADLVLADFTGYNQLSLSDNIPNFGIDPLSGDYVGTLLPPAGGFRFEVDNTAGNLPQTIYGWALLDTAGTLLLGTELIDPPVTLTAAFQVIDLGNLTLRIAPLFVG